MEWGRKIRPRKKKQHRAVPQFANVFVYKQFGQQTTSGKILFLFTKPTSGDSHDHRHFSCTNTNMAVFFKTLESVKFVNGGIHDGHREEGVTEMVGRTFVEYSGWLETRLVLTFSEPVWWEYFISKLKYSKFICPTVYLDIPSPPSNYADQRNW